MAKPHFPNEFENKENKFYRVSSAIYNLNPSIPSFVYLRFKTTEENIDYVDIRNACTEAEYNEAIAIDNKIPFNQFEQQLKEQQLVKALSSNFNKDKAVKLFSNNILTYFPSYRYEQPGYLNEPYKVNLDFKKQTGFTGYLNNPIEVISGLPQLANWIMDVVLDNQYFNLNKEDIIETITKMGLKNEQTVTVGDLPVAIHTVIQETIKQKSEQQNTLNTILTRTLISKKYGDIRLGIGQRGMGSTRIQIVDAASGKKIYPSIFNISSGESAMLCLFGEILRQRDNIKNSVHLSEITGVVLVDEVDKHLHIKLQKEVLPELFKLFPNVQFIVSSHSPFLSLGLAEKLQERSRLIDIENGLSIQPTHDKQYQEVYDMMIKENDRYKKMYDTINLQIENEKELQIITEGKNTEHIQKAITVLDNSLLDRVKIIAGAEDKSGEQQLKNTFDVMANANHTSKFLFVWDCDSVAKVESLREQSSFFKYCFQKNTENNKIKKGSYKRY